MENTNNKPVTLFLCGDVMTGRGIDQILPYPSDPRLYEPYMVSALGYLEIAENKNGPIQKPVDFDYIWGDALDELNRVMPDVRIINLETAVTSSNDYLNKGINYRMHPNNIGCITAANIDCCTLANNHVLDWGYSGLIETLETLEKAELKVAGAGQTISQAEGPAIMNIANKGRVLVFAFGHESSGVTPDWAAAPGRPGINYLEDLSDRSVRRITRLVKDQKRPNDIVVASIHWGSNWGYRIPNSQVRFAHKLIDEAAVDIVCGHSSHHVKGIEVYNNKPIIYGCGDFLNDYEGISGYEEYRDDLSLMYFVSMNPENGKLVNFNMTPMQIKNFKLNHPSNDDVSWLKKVLARECNKRDTTISLQDDNKFSLHW